MPLLSSLVPRSAPAPAPASFVVGVGVGGVLIYKVLNRKKLYKTFEGAFFSGRFFQVVVLYSEKRLINFLSRLESFDKFFGVEKVE